MLDTVGARDSEGAEVGSEVGDLLILGMIVVMLTGVGAAAGGNSLPR